MRTVETPGIIWRKAAVLGSLWAASEIVLGSFLHNARVPFSGEFLTAIGIIILVAGHRLWPERGLLWRAGLVCAAMKSVSPSAVIFGPMVAISMEGLLAEAGVRALGGNAAGYLFGGGLAMSWSFAHKAANLWLMYGPDTVNVYLRGVDRLREYFGFRTENYWAPVMIMLTAYFMGGLAAAAAGMRAGKERSYIPAASPLRPDPELNMKEESMVRAYSAGGLILHIFFIAAVLWAGRRISVPAMLAVTVGYAYVCVRSYPRARSLLKRTGIWAGVLAASLIAGAVLDSAGAGLYMALRAFMLTLAFSAIGCELMNPAIRARLERLGGGVFFEALEYAFSALPGIIAAFPSGREFARRPLAVIDAAVARAPYILDSIARPQVFLITGAHGGGKSVMVGELAKLLRVAGSMPGGICAEGLWKNGARAGFDLIDLRSGGRVPLCRREPGGGARVGEFRFFDEGMEAGRKALSAGGLAGADVVFVDEIGFWELDGGGWAAPLMGLLNGGTPLVLVVRDYLAGRVVTRFGLERATIWNAGERNAAEVLPELLSAVRASKRTELRGEPARL